MKYFIRQRTLDCLLAVPIELDKFNELKESQEILFAVQAIEEKYDLLIQNYLELEQEILSELAKNMVFIRHAYDDFYEARCVFNRRIVNFLTSAKLYIDQIYKHVRVCVGNNDDIVKKVEFFTNQQYDAHLEYRFMEALRNHVQHYCLAVHLVRNNSNIDQDNKQQVNGLKIFALKKVLQQNVKFKKNILQEIGDEVELVKTTRVYMSSLSNIHNDIRSLIKERVDIARRTIEETITNYKKTNNGSAIGLYIYSVASDDGLAEPIDSYPILLDWDDVRIKLERKNRGAVNLGKRYISSCCL